MITFETYYKSYIINKKNIIYINKYIDKDEDLNIDIYLKNDNIININETIMNKNDMLEIYNVFEMIM